LNAARRSVFDVRCSVFDVLPARFQSLEYAARRASRVWTLAAAFAFAAGMAPAVAADTNAPAPRCTALCIGVADPLAEGADRGAADAARLGEAFRAAGFSPVTVLSGDRAGRDAILAALFRLRAGLRAGDLALVAYTGPVRVERDDASDIFHLRTAGDAEDDALSVPDVLVPLAARAEADLALIVTGLPRLGARAGGTGPWRAAGSPPAALRSYAFLASGGRGELTEGSGPRTLLAANLAAELVRAFERTSEGVSLQNWLRAAVRRVTLESGARQTPELTLSGDGSGVRIRARAADVPPVDPVPSLAVIEDLVAAGRTDEALAAGLLRAADLLEGGTAPDLDACLALLDRIALASGRTDLAMIFTAERIRRSENAGVRVRLLHALGRLTLRDGRPIDAAALHRRALESGGGDAAGWAWLADAHDRAGESEPAREAAAECLRRWSPLVPPEDEEALSIAHEVLGRAAFHRGETAAALSSFEKALDTRRRLDHGDPARLSRLLREAGEIRLRSGDPEGAVSLLRESVDRIEHAVGDPLDLAKARMTLGDALAASDPDGALAAWQDAYAKWIASGPATSSPPVRLLVSIGEALTAAGHPGEARPVLDQALDRSGDDPALRIRVHRALSRTSAALRDPVGALHHAHLALATAAGPEPAEPAVTAGLCSDLAALHFERGEIERAVEYGERAVAGRGDAGLDDAATAAAWILLGRAHEAGKAHATAAAAWSNAVHVLMRVDGANAVSVGIARTREGRAWLAAGRPDPAARAFEEARLVYRIRTTADPASRADALLGLGEAQEMLGERTKARTSLESALTVAAAGGESCDGLRARALLLLARIAGAEGRLFEARRRITECIPLFERLRAPELSEAVAVERTIQTALAPPRPQGSHAEMPAFLAVEAARDGRGTGDAPR
jgi:tetratricopeptide (TPR) repeat protein